MIYINNEIQIQKQQFLNLIVFMKKKTQKRRLNQFTLYN